MRGDCRDRGWNRVDQGALCLSPLPTDPFASPNPNLSSGGPDRHKALSLQLSPSLPLPFPIHTDIIADTRLKRIARLVFELLAGGGQVEQAASAHVALLQFAQAGAYLDVGLREYGAHGFGHLGGA